MSCRRATLTFFCPLAPLRTVSTCFGPSPLRTVLSDHTYLFWPPPHLRTVFVRPCLPLPDLLLWGVFYQVMLTSSWPLAPLRSVLSGHAYLRLASFSEDCFCCAVSFAWFFSSWACCCFSVSFLNRAALSSLSKWYFLYKTTFFKNLLSVSIGYLLPKKEEEKTICPWAIMLTWETVSYQKSKISLSPFFSKRVVSYLWKIEFPPFTQIWILLTQGCFVSCLVKVVQWSWRRRFLKVVNVFFYVTIICPWKKAWPLMWTHLIPYNQRMLCATCMFGWIWTGFLEKISSEICECIFNISLLYPFDIGCGPSLVKSWFSITLGWILLSSSGEKDKNVKSLKPTTMINDKFSSEMLTWTLEQLRWAKCVNMQ